MRHIIFGLALIPLLACSGVSAGERQAPAGSDGPQNAEALPSSNPPARSSKVGKRMPKRQPQPAASPPSLQSAETYAVDHSASPPASSGAKPASPATNSWTGFHIGAGVGAAHQ